MTEASEGPTMAPSDRRIPLALGSLAALLTVVAAQLDNPGLGNDATSYVAIADRLANHGQLGYFLEPKLALWPPGWPAVLAASEWAFGVRPQITALVVNAIAVVVIAFETSWLLRRVTRSRTLEVAGVAVATIGPATVSQSYFVQTETTFVALVLASLIALIRFSDTRAPRWLAFAALANWAAFMDRYVAIIAIGAGSLWLLVERGSDRLGERARNAVGFGLISSIVPGVWLIRNAVVLGDLSDAFGPRDTPLETFKSNAVDAVTSVGQFIVGYARYEPFTGLLRLGALAVLGASGVLAVVLLARVVADRRAVASAGGTGATGGLALARDLLGHPVGLLTIYAAAHLLYMVYFASTIAFDPVNTRYLAPMFIPALVAFLALIERGTTRRPTVEGSRPGSDLLTRVVGIGLIAFVVVQLGVGVVRVSASYWDESALGYAADRWRTALDSPALNQVPTDCDRLYANFPEAMYLAPQRFEATRSPRIRKFASSDEVDDLDRATAAGEAGDKICVIWADVIDTPSYQHPLEVLVSTLDLRQVASDPQAKVAVYATG